jgi:hypothetical protein
LFTKSIYGRERIKDAQKEYKTPQKVDLVVLDDIADWIIRK